MMVRKAAVRPSARLQDPASRPQTPAEAAAPRPNSTPGGTHAKTAVCPAHSCRQGSGSAQSGRMPRPSVTARPMGRMARIDMPNRDTTADRAVAQDLVQNRMIQAAEALCGRPCCRNRDATALIAAGQPGPDGSRSFVRRPAPVRMSAQTSAAVDRLAASGGRRAIAGPD